MIERASPKGKKVSLFVTCLVDMIYPQTGMSVTKIFKHLNIAFDVPMKQTCCGQPAFNSGYHDEARTVAQQFLRAFEHAEVIVAPSGSCVAMVRHEYPALFADDDTLRPLAEHLASITWEFTEYLVDGLGIEDVGAKLPEAETFAFHDACHGLRLLGLQEQGRKLLAHVENAHVTDLHESDVCCGFGGLFSVKMPQVSTTMLDTKIKHIEASEAQTILTGDASCLMQMNGGLTRKLSQKRVQHVADILAKGLGEREHHAE
jgi:L-lactate dehydrogenase complex protein LldE